MSRIAFIFPGQGAQKAGMGKDFYEKYPVSAQVFDQVSGWLRLDMKKLCFEENDKLDFTEYTQAALLTACLAIERAVREYGLKPEVAAGLSLGEYCAVEAAGGMSLRDAAITVRERGILMEQAVPAGQGGMAAVLGLTGQEIEKAIEGIQDVEIANYNCPGQIVITGERTAVCLAAEQLMAAGARRVLPLKVSGPFHSSMMETAGEKLAQVLEMTEIYSLKIPYVTNVTAEYVTNSAQIRPLLARQISSSVRWQQSVEQMIRAGIDTFVEIGPGRTLTGFIRKIDKNVRTFNIQTVEDLEKAAAQI